MLAEARLCAHAATGEILRDEHGKPVLQCMCGSVLCCRTNPQLPFFTEGGSFWSNNTADFLAAARGTPGLTGLRNRCRDVGYESVAMIPLRSGAEIIGLLQLNDRRSGLFTAETIRFFEGLGASIGIVLLRQREESALRESEMRFHKIFAETPVGVSLQTMPGGRFLATNPTLCRMLGYSETELLRLSFQDITHPEYRESDLAAARQLWEGTLAQYKVEKRYLTKTGEFFWGAATVTVIHDENGHPLHMLVLVENIDARKRAEEEKEKLQAQLAQVQKMESVGRLAGGVAHDFNNLLTGILGYAQLCREQIDDNHPIAEWLDSITASAKRSANLTSQLLAFARKQVIAPQVVNLNEAVTATLALLRPLVGEEITIDWQPGAGLAAIKLDPAQLDQVLTNLAIRARDATRGIGTIFIKTANATMDDGFCASHPGTLPGEYVRLTFRDTGVEMAPETLAHIFEPFFAAHSKGIVGAGLGMATVFGIVKQNGGFIDVASTPAHGTTFQIYWPQCAAAAVAQPPAIASRTSTQVPDNRRTTILLAEDDESVRDITQMFLSSLGYSVLVADGPESALRLAAEHPGEIQLLLTDVIMPGMNGRDLAYRLAGTRPNTRYLFISGFTADVLTQRGALESGVHFLPKPFTRESLDRKIRECLQA